MTYDENSVLFKSDNIIQYYIHLYIEFLLLSIVQMTIYNIS